MTGSASRGDVVGAHVGGLDVRAVDLTAVLVGHNHLVCSVQHGMDCKRWRRKKRSTSHSTSIESSTRAKTIITFWDKLAHFSGKICPERLAGKFAFSFRTALKVEINSRLNLN